MRRVKRIALAVGVVAACGTGVAIANHPQVDPATVPTGFLTAHSAINNVPASVVADALKSGRTDVFIEHGRLDAQKGTGFRTSPGPVFVIVQKGSLSFRDSAGGHDPDGQSDALGPPHGTLGVPAVIVRRNATSFSRASALPSTSGRVPFAVRWRMFDTTHDSVSQAPLW